ncbi:hypothetical protein KL918_005181 [Ogataea parapolymorpha]|uniref:RNA polymerase II-associated protein 3 n=1 Tax=Ogataea parapolymorpha (strain ATCC 26012 / BCRC 20466 / JCM 22074 / NRRL Y-7560 / DL-1) TaxID=871575 RepID=W1QBR0_OGAPD|nr:hypothetical protein HPODL_04084 [Ogataea parapolymorpha DL-1]ESW98457.1 hypothetical protein HPODL_04084 [Ogataea parapolymorpha DL-1]KAG7864860.1 hypothetical protein KL918_005181 [Ogataea parapolymorpha]KAG7873364.1 hypothetical protein KL916_002313 [Ogataea parapolymorpha]
MSVEELKNQGNQAFKAGNYKESARIYNNAIMLDPGNAVLYSNKAMAYIKLKDWNGTLATCNQALSSTEPDDKTKIKLLWRKSIALQELDRFSEAKDSLQKALQLDPNNKTLKQDLESLELKIKELDAELIEIPIQFADSLPPRYLPKKKAFKLEESDIPPMPELERFPRSPTALFLSELSKKQPSEREQYYEYVLQIDSSVYTGLFERSGLDSNFLGFYVEAATNYLASSDTRFLNNIIKHLQAFVKTPRFSIASMFISTSQVDRLFNSLKAKTGKDLRSIWT